MMNSPFSRWITVLCLGLACFLPVTGLALDPSSPVIPEDVDITADNMEYDPETKVLTASGNLLIVSGDYKIMAESGYYNTATGDISVQGGVHFEDPTATWDGDALTGNLKDKTMSFGEYSATLNEWMAKGEGAELDSTGTLRLQRTAITTCEDWWLTATRFVHHRDGSFTAYNVTYRVFGVPIFYWPEVSGNTNDLNLPFGVELGHDSEWGAMVFIYKDLQVTENIKTRIQAEFRSERGYGLSNWWEHRGKRSRTDAWIHLYHDDDPLSDRTILDQDYNLRFETEEWRYRLGLDHRSEWVPDETLTLRAHVDAASDPDLRFEYFREEYRDDPQPNSEVDLSWYNERWELGLYARARVNDFETAVDRLPEVRFVMPRQNVFGDYLQYYGNTTAGLYEMRFPEYDLARLDALPDQEDYSSLRFDSLHALYLPVSYAGINFVPRAAARVTAYDTSSETPIDDMQLANIFAINDRRADDTVTLDPTSFDEDGDSLVRFAYELGFELNTKVYGAWNDYENKLLQLQGLRHIVIPYINYTYLAEPSEDKEDILFFDSVDRLDKAHFVRLGVLQRFQTLRDDSIHTFATVETFADFHFDDQDNDRDGGGDLGLAVAFMPTNSVKVDIRGIYDIDEGEISTFMASLTIGKPRSWQFSVDYYYRNDFATRYAYSMASDVTQILYTYAIPRFYTGEVHHVGWRLTVPISTRTRVTGYQFYDIEEGEFEIHGIQLAHDFKCWTVILRAEDDSDVVSFAVQIALRGDDGVDVPESSVY